MNRDLAKLEAKYWQGETTLEEESILREAALQDNPALSKVMKQAIVNISQSSAAELDGNFDEEFWAKAAERDRAAGSKSGLVLNLAIAMRLAAAAAIVAAIAITGVYLLNKPSQSTEIATTAMVEDTFEDPEQAFEAAMQALSMAGNKLNEAQQPVKEIKRFYDSKTAIIGLTATGAGKKSNESTLP